MCFNERQPNTKNIVPVPYMDNQKKMHFFRPRIHVIGLQKCMTTIP